MTITSSLFHRAVFSLHTTTDPFAFKVLKNEIAYSGWRNIIKREVLQPNGRISTFDIVSQKGEPSVAVFTWDIKTSSTTLLREYHPGIDKVLYGVIGGIYESKKHTSCLQAAQFELEEEAQLQSSQWIHLLNKEASTCSFDKYSDNVLYPYLALDCINVEKPRPMDEDEFIIMEKHVSYQKLMSIINDGNMNMVSSYMCLMALRKLDDLKIAVDKNS